MTYRITGLDPAQVEDLRGRDDAALAARGARRVTATARPGYPCRVTLDDAEPGEVLLLLHHVSHDVATPYRSAYAIVVREDAMVAAAYVDVLPPAMAGWPLGLRGFDADPRIAYIEAHNAVHGCFVARVERA